jgi:hypothetical protein
MTRKLVAGVVAATIPFAVVAPAEARSYPRCSSLQQDYPHGVGKSGARDRVRGSTAPVTNFKRSTRIYNQNRHLDGDGDGVACERR